MFNIITKNGRVRPKVLKERFVEDHAPIALTNALHIVWDNGEAIVEVSDKVFKAAENANEKVIKQMAEYFKKKLKVRPEEIFWGPVPSDSIRICSDANDIPVGDNVMPMSDMSGNRVDAMFAHDKFKLRAMTSPTGEYFRDNTV